MFGSYLRVVLAVCVIAGCSKGLRGQSATTGALEGTVEDVSGEAIPNATRGSLNRATDEVQTVVSGANGSYRFALVPPATYEVTFSAQGFKTALMTDVAVNVSEVPAIAAMLEPGDSKEQAAPASAGWWPRVLPLARWLTRRPSPPYLLTRATSPKCCRCRRVRRRM